mgnify:CR=1 FL=1
MASTAAKYATSASNNAGVGSLAWDSVNNALGNNTNDATRTTATASGVLRTTNYLQLFFTHGLAAGDVGVGVAIRIRRFATDGDDVGTITDSVVKLIKNGTIVGTNKSAGAAWPLGAGAWSSTFGGASDLWGTTFTGEDAIGVAISGNFPGSANDDAYVTAAEATFYYTPASSSNGLLLARRRRIAI